MFKIVSAADVAIFVRSILTDNSREHFVAMYLDSLHQVAAYSIVSIGTANMAPVAPREVFQRAILSGAIAIVVAHNHPSGSPHPSDEDRAVTKRLHESGNLLGIRLLDHVIVADVSHYSFKKETCDGLIEQTSLLPLTALSEFSFGPLEQRPARWLRPCQRLAVSRSPWIHLIVHLIVRLFVFHRLALSVNEEQTTLQSGENQNGKQQLKLDDAVHVHSRTPSELQPLRTLDVQSRSTTQCCKVCPINPH